MRNALQAKRVGGLEFHVGHDPHPLDPRKEFTLTEIIAWHPRYKLSDTEVDGLPPHQVLTDLMDEDKDRYWDLYLYDHGGLALSTTEFIDKWDSGHVGFVLVTEARIREAGLFSVGGIDWEQIACQVRAELREFEDYLNGAVHEVHVHRVVDNDLLMTPLGFHGNIWGDDDQTLDDVAATLADDVDERFREGVTFEAIQAAEWEPV